MLNQKRCIKMSDEQKVVPIQMNVKNSGQNWFISILLAFSVLFTDLYIELPEELVVFSSVFLLINVIVLIIGAMYSLTLGKLQ